MRCGRCGAPDLAKSGRFADKLCLACIKSLRSSAHAHRRMRADSKSAGWGGKSYFRRYHHQMHIPVRPS